jgi:hypothetical protein
MTPKTHYTNVSTHALAGFQIIEERIKEYIDFYYKTIRSFIDTNICFDFTSKDYANLPLSRLTKDVFSKTTSDKNLVKRILSLNSKRNELAHRALTVLYGPVKTDNFYLQQSKQYEDILIDLGEIQEAIWNEHVKLYLLSEDIHKKSKLTK